MDDIGSLGEIARMSHAFKVTAFLIGIVLL